MTTITINDEELSQKYSASELEMKISQFLAHEFGEEKLDIFSVDASSLSEKSQERLENIGSMNFLEY